MKNITLDELRTKRSELESAISKAINTFLEETECEIEVEMYRIEQVGRPSVYRVSTKVAL